MRQQRDRISADLSKMTKAEIVAYFKKKQSQNLTKPSK
jgi:hypothetical protein